MKAPLTDQRQLLALQDLDTRIAQVIHRKKSLPEHAELSALAESKGALDQRVVAAETRLADATVARTRAEDDLVPVRSRLEKDQRVVDAGAADPKALSALLSEIQNLTKRISDLEDVQLETMEEQETAEAELAAAKAEREAFLPQVIAVRDRREQLMAECDREQAAYVAERADQAARVPAELVALYTKIAERSGGVGAARLQGSRCGGCGMEADADTLRSYGAAADDDVVRCADCGRILVRG